MLFATLLHLLQLFNRYISCNKLTHFIFVRFITQRTGSDKYSQARYLFFDQVLHQKSATVVLEL